MTIEEQKQQASHLARIRELSQRLTFAEVYHGGALEEAERALALVCRRLDEQPSLTVTFTPEDIALIRAAAKRSVPPPVTYLDEVLALEQVAKV